MVCQRYWPENQKLIDICEGLIERGIKVDVLCGQPLFSSVQRTRRREKGKDGELINGVRVLRTFEAGTEKEGSLEIFLNYFSFWWSGLRALKSIGRTGYDKVLIYQLSPVTMCAPGLKLSRKQNIESFIYVEELWPHYAVDELEVRNGIFEKILSAMAKHYYTRADRLLVNSLNTKEYFTNTLKINGDRVIYIPQNAEKLYERREVDNDLLERFAGSFNIVYIGDIGRRQMFSTVVKAAEMIKKAGIRNIRFIIVGAGRNEAELKQKIKSAGLKEMFFFEGAIHETDIPRYLNLADVLLDTRRSNEAEDFYVPGKLASYMAAGKPLLLSMGGEAGEIVAEAGCGYVSEPEDPQALFDDMLKLYRLSRNERRVLGVNGREYQREHFSRKRSMDMLVKELFSGDKGKHMVTDGEEGSIPEGTEYDWIDDSFR